MSASDLETLYSNYYSAVDAANWSDALALLSKIAIRIVTTPEMERSSGGGGQKLKWSAQYIAEQQAFCARMAAAASAASGIYQQTNIKYVRAESTDDYA